MKTRLKTIESPQDIESLIDYLSDKEYVAVDTETTGLSKHDQVIGISVCADSSESFYIILHKWNPESNSLDPVGNNTSVIKLLISLKNKKLIGHNFVFDAIMIESNFKVRLIDFLHTDTMILAHLLNENRKIGLKDLGKEYFGESAAEEAVRMKASVKKNGGSTSKSNYEMHKADWQLLAEYGAKDALLANKLFYIMMEELFEQGLDEFFFSESMPLLKTATYDMNNIGLKVDQNKLSELKTTLQSECLAHKDFIYKEIDRHIKDRYPGTNKKTSFNIGASQQLSWLMFGVLGLEFRTLTAVGKNICKDLGLKLPYTPTAKREFIRACISAKNNMSIASSSRLIKKIRDPWAYTQCDTKVLNQYKDRYKWINELLEYKKKMKILNTYVEGIEDRIRYGIINPSFKQAGTTSGRYSSSNPNFQNLPRNDTRVKSCIVSRPGKVFVGADQSQLEVRVFASVSQDPNLMAAFQTGEDFYSVIGMKVFGITDATPYKEGSPEAFGIKYKKLRDLAKVIALASTYGATSRQLMESSGKSQEDTQQDIDNYFEEFPKVKEMMLLSHNLSKTKGYVTTLYGRKRRIPDALKINKIYPRTEHKDLPYDIRTLLNLSVNHRIQGTAASVMNRAAIKFYELLGESCIKDANIVCQAHDELIAECLEENSKEVAQILKIAMETTTTLPGVPLEALPKIGKNFSELK